MKPSPPRARRSPSSARGAGRGARWRDRPRGSRWPCSAGRADDWLALRTLPEFDRWADAGHTAQRAIHAPGARRRRRRAMIGTNPAADDPALLGGPTPRSLDRRVATACDADPEFARLPTWRGAPAETGALARMQYRGP